MKTDKSLPERTAIDSLEEQWELDEAQEELRRNPGDQESPPDYNEAQEAVDEATLAHRFASEYPPPTYSPTADTPGTATTCANSLASAQTKEPQARLRSCLCTGSCRLWHRPAYVL